LVWGGFSTQCLGARARIGWQTTQEQNTASFTLRRSTDGSNWTTIAHIPAAGNSSTTLSYIYTDPQSNGSGYYQLIEQDLDGRQTLSPVLSSQCTPGAAVKVYPNPVVNSCQVSIVSAGPNTISLQLFDAKGALIQQKTQALAPGNNQFNLSLQGYNAGTYTLLATWNDGKTTTIRLEKQN